MTLGCQAENFRSSLCYSAMFQFEENLDPFVLKI